MQLKQFYNITTKVSSKKVLLLLVIYLTAYRVFDVAGQLTPIYSAVTSVVPGQ